MITLQEGEIFQLVQSPLVALCLGIATYSHSHNTDGYADEDNYLCWCQGRLFIYTHLEARHKGVKTEDLWCVTQVFSVTHIDVPVAEVPEGMERPFIKLVTSVKYNLEDELGDWKDVLHNKHNKL